MGECGKALDGESGVGLFFTEVGSRKGRRTRPLVQYGAYPLVHWGGWDPGDQQRSWTPGRGPWFPGTKG